MASKTVGVKSKVSELISLAGKIVGGSPQLFCTVQEAPITHTTKIRRLPTNILIVIFHVLQISNETFQTLEFHPVPHTPF